MKKILSVLFVMLFPLLLTGCSKTLNTKEKVTIEYGNAISTNAIDYLDLEKLDEKKKDKIIAETKVEILDDKKVDKKDYQQIGEYIVKLTYEKESAEIKVTVSDTTKPTFNDFKEIVETYKDVKVDFVKLYKADDLSNVSITADETKIDYTKEGTYKTNVIATDEYGNTETKEATIVVKKPEIKLDKKNLSLYVNETEILKPAIFGKSKDMTFKTSNKNVADVSKSGKISAKKSGSATITITANDVSVECKVTVKSVPTGAKTEKKTITNPTTGKKEEVVVVKPSGGSSSSSATTSREAFNLINEERRKAGLPLYVWDDNLATFAKTRAKEITIKYSHVRPDGSDPLNHDGVYSEIIAHRPTATSTVKAWMNSTSHKNAILRNDLSKAGVAKCGEKWVALFGK